MHLYNAIRQMKRRLSFLLVAAILLLLAVAVIWMTSSIMEPLIRLVRDQDGQIVGVPKEVSVHLFKWLIYGLCAWAMYSACRFARMGLKALSDAKKRNKGFNNLLHNIAGKNNHAETSITEMKQQKAYSEGACDAGLALCQCVRKVSKANSMIIDLEEGIIPPGTNVDFAGVVDTVVDTEGDVAQDYGVDLVWDKPDELFLFANSEALEYMVRGIVSNAVKYTPRGGRVEARLATGLTPEQACILTVKDNGIGMSLATMRQMYDQGFRANPAGPIDGTGQGLTLTKRIVDAYDAKILCSSKEGEGTVFTIIMPGNMLRHPKRRNIQ